MARIYAYFFEAVGVDRIKIGQSTDVERRFQDIKVSCPVELKVLAATEHYAEYELHARFQHLRCHGEWFKATDELRSFINSLDQPDRPFFFKVIDHVLADVHTGRWEPIPESLIPLRTGV